MLQKRHQEMRLLANDLRMEIRNFGKGKVNQDLYSFVFSELKTRMDGLPLRAFFVKKSYELLLSNASKNNFIFSNKATDEFTVKLPFVFEVIITIQYLHNQILDKKAGVTTPEAINKNLLAGNLLKDFLYEYIEENFSKKAAKLITQTTRKAFQYTDIGQHIEKNWNTLEQFEKSHELKAISISEEIDDFIDLEEMEPFLASVYRDLPMEHHVFTEMYLKRIYLTCAALFKLAATLLCDLLQVDGEVKRNFLSFSATYGLMRQIINDNADVVPASRELGTQHRLATDAFSDWNNKNVTLPWIMFLAEGREQDAYSHPLEVGQQEQLFDHLLSSHALFKSIHQARLLAALSRQKLPFVGEDADLLLDTCEIANWNKFLAPCLKTKAYTQFKKTAAYRHSKQLIKDIELASSPTEIENSEANSWQLDMQTLFPVFRGCSAS